MPTPAERILKPSDTTIFRTAFLYAGQGDCTLHVIPDGQSGFLYALTDINLDTKRGGIDVIAVLRDLLPKTNGRPTLDAFINTHPHNDHICGLDRLKQSVRVCEVWHTGFEPSDKHSDTYKHLTALIDDVRKREGDDAIFEYQGTRKDRKLGEVIVNIVSPAKYVKDEIDKEDGEARDCRIHEYCGVLRFAYGSPIRHVLMAGDSDKCAWREHIMGEDEYHADRVKAAVLNASHHGSRSFFKIDEDDEDPYVRSMEVITPTWVVVPSPKREDSPHGHPHQDAIELYERHIKDGKKENVRILGDRPECLLYDIYKDGRHVLESDNGELLDEYPLEDEDDEGKGGKGRGRSEAFAAPAVITRVDDSKPMGAQSQSSGTT